MSAQRLYKAEWVTDEDHEIDTSGVVWDISTQAPAGWREYAQDMWPEYCACEPDENGHYWKCDGLCFKPFFWPNTDKVFRSRSSAQARVDIINRWGGRAVLVECTPEWMTVSAANARRKRERIKQRIARKTVELEALQDAFEAVA